MPVSGPHPAVRGVAVIVLAAGCSGSEQRGVGADAAHADEAGVDTGPADAEFADSEEATSSAEADVSESDATFDAADSPEGGTPETAADGSVGCNPTAPFGPPVLLAGPNINTRGQEGGPRLTADERTLYFSRNDNDGGGSHLFVAHRDHLADDFGAPSPLAALNSSSGEYDPSTVTELTLFFSSSRAPSPGGPAGYHLWMATRGSTTNPFSTPTELPEPVNSSQGGDDAQPFLRADQSELWFASNRGNSDGTYDVYMAPANGTSFGTPVRVAEISSPCQDYTPTVSVDGLLVFFSSNRPCTGTESQDIWTAKRLRPTDPWGYIQAVPALNSSGDDFPGWLSPDGCRLYLSSYRLPPTGIGSEDIYVAARGL